MEKKDISYIWKDKIFWASILIAIIAWTIAAVVMQKVPSLDHVKDKQLDAFLFVILYPIVEEIVFRGLIQENLHKLFRNAGFHSISYANLVASLLFVLLHLFYQSVYWALLVFIPSVLFGYFKDKYQSLQVPILLHCFFNAGYLLVFR